MRTKRGYIPSLSTTLAGAVLALCGCGMVQAMEMDYRFFGTLGGSCFSSNVADYTLGDQLQAHGPGRSGTCDAGLDSLLGIQLDVRANSNWSAALQFTSYRDARGTVSPKMNLAQLRWEPTGRFTLGIGRTYNPHFLHSEYRIVRYTLTPVRPPPEVYSMLETYSFDGLQALYTIPVGDWQVELQGIVGQLDLQLARSNEPGRDDIRVRNGAVAGITARRGPWIVKSTLTRAEVTYLPESAAYRQLFGELEIAYPQAAAQLALDRKPLWLVSAGLAYDSRSWVMDLEYAHRAIQGGIRDQHGAYLLVGRRIAAFTPYAGVARRWTATPVTVVAPGMQVEVDEYISLSRYDRTSAMLGVSLELGSRAIAKLQVDRVNPDAGSYGLLNNHLQRRPAPRAETLLSFNLDFLF